MTRLDRFKARLKEESNRSAATRKHQFDRRMARINRRRINRVIVPEEVKTEINEALKELDNLFK